MNPQEGKEFFAGSNSYYGFWSYFESIAMSENMARLLIKGGPGFGKSTMMKKIGAHFADRGFYTEWFRCPSDPDSMDAVAVPQAGFCIIDATAPHTLVPTRPYDEIVNLWKYWNPERHGIGRKGTPNLEAEIEKEDGKYEKWLHQTRQMWETQEKAWRRALEKEIFYPHMQHEAEQQFREIETQLLKDVVPSPQKGARRHLFAAGFTPDGLVSLVPSIFDGEWQYIGVTCCMQPVMEDLMKKLSETCQERGIRADIYHSPALPQEVDIVALPESKKAVVCLHSFGISYQDVIPESQIQRKVELCESAKCQNHLYFSKDADIQKITDFLQRRRHRHQLVEERYQPAMDYDGINAETEKMIQRFDKV